MENMIHFSFSASDILEEVKKITSYIAKNRISEGLVPVDAIIQEQDEAIFLTFLGNAEAKVYDCLSAYCKTPVCDSSGEEDESSDGGNVDFYLSLPETFNKNSARQINTEIRNALTSHVLAEWLLIASPKEAESYLGKAEQSEKNLRFKLTNRTKTVIRPLTSFP
ncbi:MAG: hypothetical protein LBK58_06000 [Prevotellaceae bacterium]|jgi:hypothetical protein|nr:hypothetical protein [Prevotellaceae bacterium]